jgi:hypothetical protein
MKFNLLLSILFAIVTSFAAIHEVEHIQHNDSSSCLVCTVNNNLVSADAVQFTADVEIFHFQKIVQESSTSYSYRKINFNQNRAPPKIS